MTSLKFGIIADVQYACVENGTDFHQTRTRYYKASKDQLGEAVSTWNENGIDFVFQLGDLLDGKCHRLGESRNCLNEVNSILERFEPSNSNKADPSKCHIHHVLGNHEFYNFTRSQLWSTCLNSYKFHDEIKCLDAAYIDEEFSYHYSFTCKTFRFIILDVYDIARIGRPNESLKYVLADQLLKRHNKTGDLMSSPDGHPNYVSWNGALSEKQLNWLQKELKNASGNNERIIIFSHCPLHPKSCRSKYLAWNYKEILEMLDLYDNVIACFAGHDHNGGYFYDEERNRIYMTLEGVIERAPHENSYGIVELFQDRMKINGFGVIENRVITF